MNVEKKIHEWHEHHVIDDATRDALRAYEAARPRMHELFWRYGLLGLAVLCVMIGLLFIVASNWQDIPFSVKLGTHAALNMALAGWLIHLFAHQKTSATSIWTTEAPLMFLAAGQLSLIALIGQYLHSSAPIEDVMLYWWALIAPMLLLAGRTRFSALVMIVLTTYVVLAKLDIKLEEHFYLMILATVILFVTSTTHSIEKRRMSWADILRSTSLCAIIILTLCSIFMRHIAPYGNTVWYMIYTVLAALLCAAATYEATRRKDHSVINTTSYRPEYHVVTLSCFVIAFTMLLGCVTFTFYGNSFPNVTLFSLYFLGIAYIGNIHEKLNWISLSIAAIAIRMIIYFVSITNNMLFSGIVMIVIGLGALTVIRKLHNNKTGVAA